MIRNIPFKTWKYKPQTKMKHLVFADYFDKWVKILGKFKSLNFIDCFGGIGAYEDKGKIELGSPLLAAKIIKENHVNLNRDTNLVIIEKKKSNIENIKNVFGYYNIDVNPFFINEDFDKAINEILDRMENLKPTFFLVDPFGFKIKLSTLKRIMGFEKSEIFLNFMYNGICRNLGVKEAEDTMVDLYGEDSWKKYCNRDDKEICLIKLFKIKLKEFSKYVFYYKIRFHDKDRTFYYLFHLTNHVKGCSIMKSSFAKYNNGRLEYNSLMLNQTKLIDEKEEKIKNVKNDLLKQYLGKKISFIEIIMDLIDCTEYLESEISSALKSLESENKIMIHRDPELTKTGRKRISILNTDTIIF